MKSKTQQLNSGKTILAFAIIYLVWGSTFLAIRIGVRELPPFLFAAMRFLVAGLALYLWMIAKGERSPTVRQWMSAVLLALLIFVVDYGLLFWAEQRVPSGVAAVMMATIPLFTAVAEIVLLGTQKLSCELTLRDGKIVYDTNGLARPDWNTLPKDYRTSGDPRWDGIWR